MRNFWWGSHTAHIQEWIWRNKAQYKVFKAAISSFKSLEKLRTKPSILFDLLQMFRTCDSELREGDMPPRFYLRNTSWGLTTYRVFGDYGRATLVEGHHLAFLRIEVHSILFTPEVIYIYMNLIFAKFTTNMFIGLTYLYAQEMIQNFFNRSLLFWPKIN